MRALLVTLGGAEYPRSPELRHAAFRASHSALVGILTDPEAPLVAAEDALDLFNDNRSWPDQLIVLRDWLRESSSQKEGSPPTDLIIHYVGHGAFKPNSVDYYLTINMTDEEVPAETSISLTGLHRVLLKHAHSLRVIIIIDACFAAAAWRHLQSGAIEAQVEAQVGEILETEGAPSGGLAVLCSSEKYETSSALGHDGLTQFGDALTTALRTGSPDSAERLSLTTLLDLMVVLLKKRNDEPIKPVLLSPRKGSEAIDRHPLFVNRARKDTPPFIEAIAPDIREKLDLVVDKFIEELTQADEAGIARKVDDIAGMGRKQLAMAAAARTPPSEPPLSSQIELAERIIDALAPSSHSRGLSLRRLYYLVNPAEAAKDYADLLSRSPEPSLLLAHLASAKEELAMAQAYLVTELANLAKVKNQLEQMYCIAHAVKGRLQRLEERARTSRPPLAAMISRNALPIVAEREAAFAEAIKAKDRQIARLQDERSDKMRTMQALDRAAGIFASGITEAKASARTLSDLAAEKKDNPALKSEMAEIFYRMGSAVAELRKSHDRARGADPQ